MILKYITLFAYHFVREFGPVSEKIVELLLNCKNQAEKNKTKRAVSIQVIM